MKKVIIVGSGLVGLATAYQISKRHPEVEIHVLEKESQIAPHQSTHNSGVIHSGIYYKPDSLKVRNCIDGHALLLDFCKAQNIEHDVCGKIILATKEEQLPILNRIYSNGINNGLKGLSMIGPERIEEIEPAVRGIQAIHVPQTGIIDFADVATKLAYNLENWGGTIHLNFETAEIERMDNRWRISSDQSSIEADLLIFCAGLQADKMARKTGLEIDLQIIPFRGEYYELSPGSQNLVQHLVYPVPNPSFPFLGVHFTRMIKGGVEAGPNAVLAFKREGYSRWHLNIAEFSEILAYKGFRILASKYWRTGLGEFKRSFNKSAFLKALQELIPEITSNDISRGRSGVRAMACRSDGEMIDDFRIEKGAGMIHVLNAPSPAATSCLSIGNYIAEMAEEQI